DSCFLFLETDDFDRDHARMVSQGVHFREAPRSEAYGKVAVFEDLHDNAWDLIGPA
ncbi:MAG: VOC family protein, partial [Sphingomonadales bacterium]